MSSVGGIPKFSYSKIFKRDPGEQEGWYIYDGGGRLVHFEPEPAEAALFFERLRMAWEREGSR